MCLLAWSGLAALPAAAGAQEAPGQQSSATSDVDVRIVAQRHDNDDVEFGLQLRLSGEPWSEPVLPNRRFFPPEAEVGNWLVSSGVGMRREDPVAVATVVELRIAARRVQNDRVEFALQQRHPGQAWGELQLPDSRFFPMATEAGRWLVSSPLAVMSGVPIAEPQPADSSGDAGEPPATGTSTSGDEDGQPGAVQVSDDVLDFDMIDVQTGETVNIRSVVNGETPLLFWLWSPY